MTDIEEALEIIWDRCQHCKDVQEALEILRGERPQGEWGKWIISEVRCPECLEYFDTDCYVKGELDKCPSCGARMKGGKPD